MSQFGKHDKRTIDDIFKECMPNESVHVWVKSEKKGWVLL